MPALLNAQERWRPATIQCCPQTKPADLTLTRSGDKFPVCVRVCDQWMSVCVPACLFAHPTAANQFDKHTIEAHYSLRQLQILAFGL